VNQEVQPTQALGRDEIKNSSVWC